MICRACLRRAAGLTYRPAALRTFTTSIPIHNAAAPATAAIPNLSTPLTKPGESDASSSATVTAKAALSSCPEGTVLTGLNYLKGKNDPVAMADEQYPDWLWRCLDVQTKTTEAADETAGDEFSKSRKQRRLAAKRQRQLEAKLLASGDIEALAPKIPLQQQTIDLPSGSSDGANALDGAVYASDKREELRKAMRKERRAKIKETNYLKSM